MLAKQLMKQAMTVISSCNQTQSSPIVPKAVQQTISDNSQLSTETVNTTTNKREFTKEWWSASS